MRETNLCGDNIIKAFPGDIHDETRVSGEGGLPPEGPVADSSDAPAWGERLKRRWNFMLAWLAKGAEHACPT